VEPGTSNWKDTNKNVYETEAKVFAKGYGGDIKFCVSTELNYRGELMSTRRQKLTLKVNYEGVFSIDELTTTKFDGIFDVNKERKIPHDVKITVCNSDGDPIDSPTLALGQNLLVCIYTATSAFVITSVDEFRATNDKWSLSIKDNREVVIKTLNTAKVTVIWKLPARFFEEQGSIKISGTVTLESVLEDGAGSRHLQQDTADDSPRFANFGLTIDIIDDSSSASKCSIMVLVVFSVTTLLFI